MRNIFQRTFTSDELTMYQNVISQIKQTNKELINELEKLIAEYNDFNRFEFSFYLTKLSKEEKIEYFKQLKEKLEGMNNCDKVRVRIAKAIHPMCWCYYLSKYFKSLKFLEKFIMYGFCVPFLPGKPIMLAQYVFKDGEYELKNILAHELTHSLMNTKDLNAISAEDAINDAWTLCFLY